jgi:ABC-type antimicrobial peptide transport system permease subunit
MALGANRSEILCLIGKQGLIMIAIGLVIGFIASLAFERFLASFLYGVKPTDLLSYVAVLLILLLVGCAAILVPAYRASRIEPADSLRMN